MVIKLFREKTPNNPHPEKLVDYKCIFSGKTEFALPIDIVDETADIISSCGVEPGISDIIQIGNNFYVLDEDLPFGWVYTQVYFENEQETEAEAEAEDQKGLFAIIKNTAVGAQSEMACVGVFCNMADAEIALMKEASDMTAQFAKEQREAHYGITWKEKRQIVFSLSDSWHQKKSRITMEIVRLIN